MKKDVIWKKITYPGVRPNLYMISEYGEVMNIIRMRKLKPFIVNDGYIRYTLCADNSKKCKTIHVFAHRLVAYEFLTNKDNKTTVDHIDGNKQNNYYKNLEWVSLTENLHRAIKLGLINNVGYNHSSAKFTEEDARRICEKLSQGCTIQEIFQSIVGPNRPMKDNISLYQFIKRLKHREGWHNITSQYDYEIISEKGKGKWTKPKPGFKGGYSEELIRAICKSFEDGKSSMEILEDITGSSKIKDNRRIYDLIDGIRRRLIWTEISCEYNIDNNSTPTRNTSWTTKVADLVDEGYTNLQIAHIFGAKWDSPERSKLYRMIDRYRDFKKVNSNITIEN